MKTAQAREALGNCFGIRCGASRRPYLPETPPEAQKVIREIAAQLAKIDPLFQFSALQVNRNLRCRMHVDQHNVGQAYIITLGLALAGNTYFSSSPNVVPELFPHAQWARIN